jgi:hypothetical protein
VEQWVSFWESCLDRTVEELIIQSWMEFGRTECISVIACPCLPTGGDWVIEHRNDDLAGQRVVFERAR